MIKKVKCLACDGTGTIVDNLDGPNFPAFDDCEDCGGTGQRDVEVNENEQEPLQVSKKLAQEIVNFDIHESPYAFRRTGYSHIIDAKLRPLVEACEAALKYDAAISKRAETGDVEVDAVGALAEGADLDALYMDWMQKAKAALQKVNS